MNSHEVFIHIHQGCFAGTGAIVRLPQCQWSKPDGYGKISQCITTTKHSKAKTVCIFLGIYGKVPVRMWIILLEYISHLSRCCYLQLTVYHDRSTFLWGYLCHNMYNKIYTFWLYLYNDQFILILWLVYYTNFNRIENWGYTLRFYLVPIIFLQQDW